MRDADSRMGRRARVASTAILCIALAGGCVLAEAAKPVGCLSPDSAMPPIDSRPAGDSTLYLRKATGDLDVNASSTLDAYTAYFMIPIAYGDQAPVLLTVSSPELVGYRYLRLTPPNVIVAARMKRAGKAVIHWESWVLIRKNEYSDRPDAKPIPSADQIPAEIRPWLQPSDCVQALDPFVQGKAQEVRGDTSDEMVLADRVAAACGAIGGDFSHQPVAFDAFYTLHWGNSCTGHAHAGAALFRGNGVPSRVLMVMPSWFNALFDMHWIIEYYVPDYGWIRLESTLGQNPVTPDDEMVVMVCNPEDEFPLFYPEGIEGYWHTSDRAMGVGYPDWGGAHRALRVSEAPASAEDADEAIALGKTVFDRQVNAWGLDLPADQQAKLQEAYGDQAQALDRIEAGDVAGFLSQMRAAADAYALVPLNPEEAVFSEDFESGASAWTHGGKNDTWALGTPAGKPASAHSGSHCYGTGFSGGYRNDADCWLLSPPFDLRDKTEASLSFWLYNWVQDGAQTVINDPLWMEVATDGQTFLPLCSDMGGVNEDPAIPAVGGWARMVLDLSDYLGKENVQVRFRFRSDGSVTLPGSYVDDFVVSARRSGSPGALACAAAASPDGGPAPLTAHFTGSASGGSPPYAYAWSFGDGAVSSEQNPVHTYAAAGSFAATLEVKDSLGNSASSQAPVHVTGPAPTIAGVTALSGPFRLSVSGSGFGDGCVVKINGTSAPETARKSDTLVQAGKGPALKAMLPRGAAVQVTVANADGGTSAPYAYTR